MQNYVNKDSKSQSAKILGKCLNIGYIIANGNCELQQVKTIVQAHMLEP